MAEINHLTDRPNVELLRGAMQHWRDLDTLVDPRLLNRVAATQVWGRTLVLGPTTKALRELVIARADEPHFLVRSAADADELARSAPDHQIWCGDISALRDNPLRYDTVICLADLASIVSLELETRTWHSVALEVLELLTHGGNLVLGVENDLGLHRITASHDPRIATADGSWAPMSTWDRSRPRSLQQVRAFAGDSAAIYAVWPSFAAVTGMAEVGSVSSSVAECVAFQAATLVGAGPDPAYLVSAAGAAGRINDHASGWLLVTNPRSFPSALIYEPAAGHTLAIPADGAGISALSTFHDLALACDLPGIRELIGRWSLYHAASQYEADLGLTLVQADGTLAGLCPLDKTHDGRLEALSRLAALIRDRGWVTPWPATDDAASRLRQLNAMAGLPPISYDEALRLLPPASPVSDLDSQGLASVFDEQTRELGAMRSKLRWVELQLEAANTRIAQSTPQGIVSAAVKKARGSTIKFVKRVLKEFGLN